MNSLKEWTVHYIKQKDMMRHDLVSFKEEEDRVLCEQKDGHATYYCWQNLEMPKLKAIAEGDAAFFVTMCNEHNFKLLIENWSLFKARPGFTFIFLNPGYTDKWIIKPFIHAKIADPATLKQGLRTMYDTCLGKGE